MRFLSIFFLFMAVRSSTPYIPTAGWTYYIEANREHAWPSCSYRFISTNAACTAVDLWNGAGSNQQFTLEAASGSDTFFIKTPCGKYLSYPGDCNVHTIDTWPQAGINQEFQFIPTNAGPFEYFISAVGRSNCAFKYLSFPVPCTTNQPDKIDFWSAAGPDQTFRIHPAGARSPFVHKYNSDRPCADPFAWYSNTSKKFQLLCTSGGLDLSSSASLSPDTKFSYQGSALGGTIPGWASSGSRWAPENIEVQIGGQHFDVIFWANGEPGNTHRIGWASSAKGPLPGQWDYYAPNYLNLGGAAGGDIDAHVFYDGYGTHGYYLVWKTDDNNVGATTTRIWAQKITFSANGTNLKVAFEGGHQVILDSTGLWWVDSWIAGGSLIEGPEIVYEGGYYYLFFASGKFCESSYREGVARSRNVLGPYEKMQIPLLSTGLVGNTQDGHKLLGPGHASYAKDEKGKWMAVWHASTGADAACQRYPFISQIEFGASKWPYVNF